MLGALIGVCALLGLAIGSFLNVVIYRVPRHESIVSPGSACPACGTPIAGRDNVPVLSWLLLRGRCRHCQNPISIRYPLVEVSGAALFAGAAAREGYVWNLPATLAFLAALFALACIDFEQMLLPKRIVYVAVVIEAALLLLAAGRTGEWHPLVVGALSALGWFVVFFVINAVSPRALGFGDVRLALLLGLGLGWFGVRYVLLGFFAANVVGAGVGIFLMATKRATRTAQVPYGVFLALGAALAIYAGPEILSPFAHYH